MLARLALERDREALHRLGALMLAEFRPYLAYDRARGDIAFNRYLGAANPTFFVVEGRDRQPVGMLMAMIYEYVAASGFFISQEILFVEPGLRGTRAAAALVKAFNAWADVLKPDEVFMGVATGHRPEATARFMQRFGFRIAGNHLLRVGGKHDGKGR